MTILKLLSSNGFISYNKAIAKRCGVHETIVLGELCSIFDYFHYHEFFINQERISNDTALSVKQIRTALSNLEKMGIITISKKGVPCKNWYFINEEVIETILENEINDSQTEELDVPNLPNLDGTKSTSSSDKTVALLNNNTNIRIDNNNTYYSDKPNNKTAPFPELRNFKKDQTISKRNKKQQYEEYLSLLTDIEREQSAKCVDLFIERHKQLDSCYNREKSRISWQVEFAKYHKESTRPFSQIQNVLEYGMNDEFWKTRLSSPKVLFNAFETILQQSLKTSSCYKNNKQRGSLASEVYGEEQHWSIE